MLGLSNGVERLIVADYGDDEVMTVDGALAWTAPARARVIESAAHYVGACRRVAACAETDLVLSGQGRIDGRLVACGWQHETPTAWVGGRLAAFVAYYGRATTPGRAPGSTYNAYPDVVYQAWRAGVPPWIVRALGALMPLCGYRPLPQARLVRLRRAARAAARSSVYRWSGDIARLTFGALAALGRVSPELQRLVLDCSGYYDGGLCGLLTPRQLRWDLAAPVARRMAAEPAVRAAWARGKRRDAMVGGRAGRDLVAHLAPAWPGVPVDWAWVLACGYTPADLSGGVLSADEAERWLSEQHHSDWAPAPDPVEHAIAWLHPGWVVDDGRDRADDRW